MSIEVAPEIRDNYSFYNSLLRERKSIFDELIEISNPSNNANYLEKTTSLKHTSQSNEILFIVNVSISNHKFFKFKLRCKDLSDRPFFRYDSDGVTHRNYDSNIPFKEQQIPTPHFHFYNENGVNIAYKTSHLKNELECKALEDINLCIIHYCHEANIRLQENEFPSISISPATLQFDLFETDPNSNVNFI